MHIKIAEQIESLIKLQEQYSAASLVYVDLGFSDLPLHLKNTANTS